jgi:phage baseplate assembly protein V
VGIPRAMLGQLERFLRPLKTRLANSIARGVVQLVDDATKLQLVQLAVLQLLDDGDPESVGGAERFQSYGFSAVPLPGAEAVAIFPNGDRGHPLVVAIDDRRHRPTGGQPGEAVMYTDEGDQIRLARGHVIILSTTGQIRAGSAAASAALAFKHELEALKLAIGLWVPQAGDGGASLKTIFSAWATPGTTKLKAE